MSSIKTKDREKLNFENLHKNPSETLTNYIIRRQRVYFKAFPGGGGYDPIAKCVWDTAIVGGGDGNIVKLDLNGKDTRMAQKAQFYGAIHGLSSSPDGL